MGRDSPSSCAAFCLTFSKRSWLLEGVACLLLTDTILKRPTLIVIGSFYLEVLSQVHLGEGACGQKCNNCPGPCYKQFTQLTTQIPVVSE
jgi:hypothetical protein